MNAGTIGTAFDPDKHREAIAKANEAFLKKQKEPFCVACFTIKQFGHTELKHDCLNPPKPKVKPKKRWL